MRFVDIHGDKEAHYEEVNEYARQRQENEQRILEEQKIRAWFAQDLEIPICLKMESAEIIKYIAREAQILKTIFGGMEIQTDEKIKPEQLWSDFLLYYMDLFSRYFVTGERKNLFVQTFSQKVLHLQEETVRDFINYNRVNDRRYTKYMIEAFSLEKDNGQQFWRLLCQAAKVDQMEQYIRESIKFIHVYTFYLYLKVHTQDFYPCEKALKQYKAELLELLRNQKSGRVNPPNLKKLENPLYCIDRQNLLISMRMILFTLNRKLNDEEGEFYMIEELYRQIQEKQIVFDEFNSIIPEEINKDICAGKLPEFQDYDSSVLQEKEIVHYLDHTVLYQGRDCDVELQFRSYKGILIFTDRRIIFKGENLFDLEYKKISRVIEYDVIPEILEVRSGNKINYFQLPNIETAYKTLRLIANRKKGEKVVLQHAPFSYEELVEKANIKAYIFAFAYMASGDMPEKLKEMLKELNRKLSSLKVVVEKNPQREEEIYQFLHYYIPETVKLVQSYQKYQGMELTDKLAREVYEKVKQAVQALDGAIYQKICEIYQTSARDTIAGADALKEILGQDGYVDPSFTIK